ncbi:dTDP-4-dehydrorhamnose 3,5-epimerase family protein [Phaeobacter marinintestinus]|uniref:dTDP-4-dehydrorhamnose 3,5-epimerase family protein n=1 Tax=Falsiphaeobacter marinintestinus TaxID=1492905 RepID=UPI0011B7C859|nr:dTDP-4-dehydrorhamnose 3,5-epimerase family protein [Phaeobacter marinintestinus]
MSDEPDLLFKTLSGASRDHATVTPEGTVIADTPFGSVEHRSTTHVDNRGTVTELFDTRWDWHPDPISFAYTYTIRQGWAKGWGLHKLHEDRYFLLEGRMQIACYDVRADSPTYGQVSHIILSQENPRIVSIPKFVWHANINIGSGDVRVVNFPTMPYDHENPDKYRLPLDTDLIPYKIESAGGW